jgi:hypothetical protein
MKEFRSMAVQMQTKKVVSVAEMARMCSLSRARWYQLVNEQILPSPIYDVRTRRPFYSEEMQLVCLEVRRRNCGINGQPILFYSPRHPLGVQPKPLKKPKAEKPKNQHTDLIDNLRGLGLEATAAQAEFAVKELYPSGFQNLQSAEITRAVFLYIKRRNSGDNVGR